MHAQSSASSPAAIVCRDVALEMSHFMLAHQGCTREQLLEEFTSRQIDRYALEAKSIADRRKVKRVA